jgi:hypothetical protein
VRARVRVLGPDPKAIHHIRMDACVSLARSPACARTHPEYLCVCVCVCVCVCSPQVQYIQSYGAVALNRSVAPLHWLEHHSCLHTVVFLT